LAMQAALLSGVHVLAALCSLAPLGAEWEGAALAPALRRWLVAQALCVPAVLLAWLLSRGGLGGGLDVAAGALSLATVAALIALALRRRA
jgi:hypothetical protein